MQPSNSDRSFRHWGAFLFSGATAFLVDAIVTLGLIEFAGLDRLVARVVAILVAMVVAWLLHRRLSFRVDAPPSLNEFLRFAVVAWSANAINYLVYLGILIVWPATHTLVALVIATIIAAIFSYVGFRFGVFREPPPVA